MNWRSVLSNQWFQLCLTTAICAAGAGLYDLSQTTSHLVTRASPTPSQLAAGPTPTSTASRPPDVSRLHAKTRGHWIVDSAGAPDADGQDLNQIVASANNGDTISIRPGTYQVSVVIDKDLILTGTAELAQGPVIEGQGEKSNVFNVSGGHVIFSNLRIEKDVDDALAAIYCGNEASVDLVNCAVSSKGLYCVAAHGDSQLTVRGCSFRSSNVGHGVEYFERSHGNVLDSQFIENKWGLVSIDQSQVELNNCTFERNGDSKGFGSPTAVEGSGATIDIKNSRFEHNTGAIGALRGGDLIMENCDLEHNGVSLEGDQVSSGVITVQSRSHGKLTGIHCSSNDQGISILSGAKVELNNIALTSTGIRTSNKKFAAFCNGIYASGDGSAVSISGATLKDTPYSNIVILGNATATVTNCSVSNAGTAGLYFGSDDGTQGHGTVTSTNVFSNSNFGISVKSGSRIEVSGGEVYDNKIGIVVVGNGSDAVVNKTSIRDQSVAGILLAKGGSMSAKDCLIARDRIGIQVGEAGKDPGSSLSIETCNINSNEKSAAEVFDGSVITEKSNRLDHNGSDFVKFGTGTVQTIPN